MLPVRISDEIVKAKPCDKTEFYSIFGIKLNCEEYSNYEFILDHLSDKHKGIRFNYNGKYYDYYDEQIYNNLDKYRNGVNAKLETKSNKFGFSYTQIYSIDLNRNIN